MKILVKYLAEIWLISLTIASFLFYSSQSTIEAHALPQVLKFGFDAFGRNCFFLTLSSIAESLKSIIPVAVLCLFLAIFTSSFTLSKNDRFSFFLRACLDTLSSLPGFLIALAMSLFFVHPESTFILGAILTVYPSLTRFLESQILKLRTEDYIKASEALGGTAFHVFWKHYLPELLRLILAISPFLFTRLILVETTLSFLGLGSAPEHETWGRLLYQGKDYFLEAPWIMAIAAIPLFLTLFSFHWLGREQ